MTNHTQSKDIKISVDESESRTLVKSSCSTRACLMKVPWVTLLVAIVLIICAILEFVFNTPSDGDFWRINGKLTDLGPPGIRRWNVFISMLFHGGGFTGHFIPNFVWGVFCGCITEHILGSINMMVVVAASYTFAVLYDLIQNDWEIQPINGKTGFSCTLYQWYSVTCFAVFLHFWWRPYRQWKINRQTNGADSNASFGSWLWWFIGILLQGGGWVVHFFTIGFSARVLPPKPDNVIVDLECHEWGIVEGYGVSLIVAAVIWIRYKMGAREAQV